MKPRLKVLSGSWVGSRRVEVTDETGTRIVATDWPSEAFTPDWRDTLRNGDVLRSRNGRLFRVVRKAMYHSTGKLHSATFSIQRCSRYRRPYTGYLRNDLKQSGYSKVGVRVKLDKEFDVELMKNILDSGYRTLYCWDTVGVAP